MTMLYQSEKPAIHRSMQVWICKACGGQDHKSCGCNSDARAEELAAKKEAHRQAARTHREKTKENQGPRDNHASIENIEDFASVSAEARKAQYANGNGSVSVEAVLVQSSKLASQSVEFAQKFAERLHNWLEERPRLSEEATIDLSNALFLCAEEFERMARHIQSLGRSE